MSLYLFYSVAISCYSGTANQLTECNFAPKSAVDDIAAPQDDMEDVQQLLNKYKLRVKHWEHDFKKRHNRKPSKVSSAAEFANLHFLAHSRSLTRRHPTISPCSTTFGRPDQRSSMRTRSTTS